jgi:hypothetical protein
MSLLDHILLIGILGLVFCPLIFIWLQQFFIMFGSDDNDK